MQYVSRFATITQIPFTIIVTATIIGLTCYPPSVFAVSSHTELIYSRLNGQVQYMNQFAAIAQIHFAIVVIAIIIGFACYIPSVRAICNFVVLNGVILTLCFLSCNSHFTRSLYTYIYVVVDIQLSQTVLSNDGLAYFVSSIRRIDYLYFSCIFIAPIWEVCSILTCYREVSRLWPACTLALQEECSYSITPSSNTSTC